MVQSLSLIVAALWLCANLAAILIEKKPVSQNADNCISCHARDQVVGIYRTSAHAKSGITCDGCHGGDSSQSDKAKAHSGFVARPDTAATLTMCGNCHRQPLEFFKVSKHVASRPNAARLDCVECHGVHAIGASSESFHWPQFCAGCHGLEYLPQLPKPFQEMLQLSDDVREGVLSLEAKGRPHPDLVARRKEIRHMVSELVHRTDATESAERVAHILELGVSLRKEIAAEQSK